MSVRHTPQIELIDARREFHLAEQACPHWDYEGDGQAVNMERYIIMGGLGKVESHTSFEQASKAYWYLQAHSLNHGHAEHYVLIQSGHGFTGNVAPKPWRELDLMGWAVEVLEGKRCECCQKAGKS